MECGKCGATLREGARFCNKCGAIQPGEASGDQQDTPAVTSDATSPASESDAGSSGRVPRPPRVPRATDGAAPAMDTPASPSRPSSSRSRSRTAPVATDLLDEPTGAPVDEPPNEGGIPVSLATEAEAESTGLAEPEPADLDGSNEETGSSAPATPGAELPIASSPDDALEDAEVPADAPPEATPPAAEPGAVSSPAAQDWEDADTVEYHVVLERGQSLDAVPVSPQPSDMPALSELAHPQGTQGTQGMQSAQGDALPWPLPESIIVGGRYRVEEAITTVPDGPGAQNVYRVHDLQGYERCWSCGTEHGEAGATDRFCQKCGADMLSRDYLMQEQRPNGEHAEGDTEASAPEGGAADAQSIATFTQGARIYRILPRTEEPLFPRGVRVVAAMASDTGISRTGEENEDSAGVLTLSIASDSHIEPLILCVVADGLGGHASGQEASRLTVQVLSEHIVRTVTLPHISASGNDAPSAAAAPPAAPDDEEAAGLIASLTEGIEAANKALCARNKAIRADMGSTCVAALLHRDTAYFANAGDSRGYVLEDDGLRRITTDHSLVEQLITGGLITAEERYTHPQRNQIFRSLGDEPKVELDTFTQKLRPGMRLLLCSDGLWEMVRDDEMARILRETAGPQQACDVLISAANDHGGEDNISAIVVDIYA